MELSGTSRDESLGGDVGRGKARNDGKEKQLHHRQQQDISVLLFMA
jgi:hypothetical protein